jgi:hypothetical protein
MKEYYTYAYLREDGTPYYIGKGKGNRAYKDHKGYVVVPPVDRVLILKHFDNEEDAFKHEIYLIGVLGRKDLGTGILWNRTNGGDGTSGATLTEATRSKMSKSRMGNKNHFYGRQHTPESIDKMKESKRGSIPHNKGKYAPEDRVSPHALYMREWRRKRAEENKPYR